MKSPIHESARNGGVASVLEQLAGGIDVDARDPETDRTPLMEAVAAANPSVELVRLLVERGADVNAVVATLQMEEVPTSGKKPGWISRHRALPVDGGIRISGGKISTCQQGTEGYADNVFSFFLELDTSVWRGER